MEYRAPHSPGVTVSSTEVAASADGASCPSVFLWFGSWRLSGWLSAFNKTGACRTDSLLVVRWGFSTAIRTFSSC